MDISSILHILKDKDFRTSEAENPELVSQIRELQDMGLVRMMVSADDGSISVALTTDGLKKMGENPPMQTKL